MKQIGSLFDKYRKTLRPPQASIVKEAQQVIQQVTQVTVTVEQLSYSPASKTLTLNTPSVIRSELLKRKKDILQVLQKNLGSTHAPTEML